MRSNGTCCDIVDGQAEEAVAVGAYTKGVEMSGWDVMEVSTNASASPRDAGFAAGLLEGFATQRRIYDAYVNFATFFFKDKNRTVANACVLAFVEEQWAWMGQQAEAACSPGGANCSYWTHVAASMQQARGIHAGYALAAPREQELSWHEVYQLTNAGDLEDLLRAFPDGECAGRASSVPPLLPPPSREELRALADGEDPPPEVRRAMHCSGFLRLLPGRDLLTGHTTFNALEFMLRVFKIYRMPLPGAAAAVTTFSARPGDLHSKDDWYALSSNLTVQETSLTVFNRSTYAALRPTTVPCWVRVSVANRLAGGAAEWAAVFALHASGTHNNDWIAADYKALQDPERPVAWRLEEMPGMVRAWDATPALLRDGFLFSVNIPNDTDIDVWSGYNDTGFSLLTDPRARIFRRDGGAVRDLGGLRQLMTSNDYATDPISNGNPCNAISARCDLPRLPPVKGEPYAFGGIDAKLIDAAGMAAPAGPSSLAQSGPTHATQPVFSFEAWDGVSHAGMPQQWPFAFEAMQPLTRPLA